MIDRENGRLWVHDLASLPKKVNTIFSSTANEIIGSSAGLSTLHHGTGVGRAIPLPDFYVMPDGHKLYCDTGTASSSSPNNEIWIENDDGLTRIQLMQGTNFVIIADNWERMVVVTNGHQLTIYDLRAVIKTATRGWSNCDVDF